MVFHIAHQGKVGLLANLKVSKNNQAVSVSGSFSRVYAKSPISLPFLGQLRMLWQSSRLEDTGGPQCHWWAGGPAVGWSNSAAELGGAGIGCHQCHCGVLPASTGMQYHKLTEHLEEKPFSCQGCGAKHMANPTLENHLWDWPFMCKHCLMTFMQGLALDCHTKKKHAEGELLCLELALGSACSIHPFMPFVLSLPLACFPILWATSGHQATPRSFSPAWVCFQLPTLSFPHLLEMCNKAYQVSWCTQELVSYANIAIAICSSLGLAEGKIVQRQSP